MTVTSEKCRSLLLRWSMLEQLHPCGPSNRDLFERVCKVMEGEPDDTPESIYLTLANEIRGVGAIDEAEPEVSLVDVPSARILLALRRRDGVFLKVPEIVAETEFDNWHTKDSDEISASTVRRRLKQLRADGYVCRLSGENSGTGLTSKGRQMAESLRLAQIGRN